MNLLLDEHVSPAVAKGFRLLRPKIPIVAMQDWHSGAFLGQSDVKILWQAHAQVFTLVTYDQKTIRPFLRELAEQLTPHSGVIFVDEKTIAPSNIGALVKALAALADERASDDWKNRVLFLSR